MPQIKKIPTPEELLQKFSSRCATTEYAPYDILQKAVKAGASREVAERIVDKLVDNNFINEERYARAFVHDKFELSRWGKIKISAALRQKKIPADIISTCLEDIDNEKYLRTLKDLLTNKDKTINEADPYNRVRKLAAFATSRGFESHLVFDTIEVLGQIQ